MSHTQVNLDSTIQNSPPKIRNVHNLKFEESKFLDYSRNLRIITRTNIIMECCIPGANIKILSRIITALSKIGDDIFLEPKKDCLCLKSVNMTTTAFCTISLFDIFFTRYEVSPTDKDDLLCRLPMKGILGIFKSHGHKDKKPEFCKIELGQNATKIVFTFRYKHDVTVVRSLYLSDGHTVNVAYDKEKAVNHIGGNARTFSQVLGNFQMNDEDMSIEVTPEKALIRNYAAGESAVTRSIRSQITLTAGEFQSYKIDAETNVTFSLKPFRAAVQFAEATGLPILLNFDKCGLPALLEIKSPTFDLNFIMATLKHDSGSQSSLSSTVHLTRKKNAAPNKELNNINWDDFNEPMETCTDKQDDVVSRSPESPRSKKIKSIFGRCCDATFLSDAVNLGGILAPDSDLESD